MTSRYLKFLIIAFAGLCAASLILPNIANAKHTKHVKKYGHNQIRVESGYGNGVAYTSVRRNRGSKEVRGPGGTWVSCFGGCENAYREEYLDFWETIGENGE